MCVCPRKGSDDVLCMHWLFVTFLWYCTTDPGGCQMLLLPLLLFVVVVTAVVPVTSAHIFPGKSAHLHQNHHKLDLQFWKNVWQGDCWSFLFCPVPACVASAFPLLYDICSSFFDRHLWQHVSVCLHPIVVYQSRILQVNGVRVPRAKGCSLATFAAPGNTSHWPSWSTSWGPACLHGGSNPWSFWGFIIHLLLATGRIHPVWWLGPMQC